MFNKPWLITLGPMSYPTAARDELNAIATGLEPKEVVDKIWTLRDGSRRIKPRAKWPQTNRIKGSGYKLVDHEKKVLRLSPPKLRSVNGTGKPAPQGSQRDH